MNAQQQRTCTFKDTVLHLTGKELKLNDQLPKFTLVGTDMADSNESLLDNKIGVIISVPSLDTPVCALETKKFNEHLSKLGEKVKGICISRDLPFAQKRYCGNEGVENVVTMSDYKYRTFGESFGTLIKEWELLSRAIFVVDTKGILRYIEYVPEISSEPNYDSALQAVKSLL
jgi:thioredoxin-dependent peroxiredoxin